MIQFNYENKIFLKNIQFFETKLNQLFNNIQKWLDCQLLFTKIGKVKKVTELKPENQLRGKFQIEGENGMLEIYFTLTPENPALIQQLDVKESSK